LKVVVVGAGIVGAAVAYESARAGAEVVLVDRSLPASGVTGDSVAWVGGPRGGDVPDGSTPLHRQVLQEYRRWEAEVPGVQVRWRGSLVWAEEAREHRHCQPEERLIDAAEAGRLEPHLTDPPARALHLMSDGAVDPVAVTQALVRAARTYGARLLTACPVTALRRSDGQVVGVETSTGFLPATTVVVTAGAQAPMLCAPLGFDLPVSPSLALLVRCTAPAGLVRTLVATPRLEVREAAAGRLLIAADHRGELDEQDLQRAGEEVLRRLSDTLDGGDDVLLDGVRLGARPMPVDGLPVIGPVPGVAGAYVAVMHSGVTLAPAVARLVAAEVVRRVHAPELEGVRPDRFQSTTVADSITGTLRSSPSSGSSTATGRSGPGSACPDRCRDEQRSANGEPRVPEDEAPVRLHGAHVLAQLGRVRGEQHLQRYTSQHQPDTDDRQEHGRRAAQAPGCSRSLRDRDDRDANHEEQRGAVEAKDDKAGWATCGQITTS